jgi:methylated-DNA-[protein]-cysteine S-methyltransferase
MPVYFSTTALGKLGIRETDGNITQVYFATESPPAAVEIQETDLIKAAFLQLTAYFNGQLQEFSLPLAPQGTDFMQAVWSALRAVRYGKTASYQDIATAIGNPKAVRAVGQANHRNPLPIFIPCHRIIGSNGKLVGYAGGLSIKQQLLALEKQHKVL